MSDFYKRFLTEDGRRLDPESGRYIALAAFGKHPGWDDHIEDLGLETESLNLAKRVLYVQGVGGQIDRGAWEKLKEEQRIPAFNHTFVWRRGGAFLIGRMWSSSDGKGRTRYPMIVCAHCVGVPLTWGWQMVLPRLLDLEKACQAAGTAAEVRSLLASARTSLRNAARVGSGGVEREDLSPDLLRQFATASAFGPAQEGFFRILYWLQTQAAAFGPGRYEIRDDMSGLRAQQLRVPLGVPSPSQSIPLLARFLAGHLDPRVPELFLWSSGETWMDVTLGEPSTQEFFCLRAAREAIPLATEVPYDLDQKFRESGAAYLSRFQNGGAAPAPVAAERDRGAPGAGSGTQRWFKRLSGGLWILFGLVLVGVLAVVVVVQLQRQSVSGVKQLGGPVARNEPPNPTPAPATREEPAAPASTPEPGNQGQAQSVEPSAQAAPETPAPAPPLTAAPTATAPEHATTELVPAPVQPAPADGAGAAQQVATAAAAPAASPSNEVAATAEETAPVAVAGEVKVLTNAIGMVLLWVAGLPESGAGGWVGKEEVTQAQYEAVAGTNPSRFKDPAQPVENVSWDEATAYCVKLTAEERVAGRLPEGFVYALPTQEQWDFFLANARFEDAVTSRSGATRTAPARVGTRPPNRFGLYDVLGNVWEWCADGESPGMKVLKGGAYNSGESFRFRAFEPTTARQLVPGARSPDAGFRCVLARRNGAVGLGPRRPAPDVMRRADLRAARGG